MDEKYRDFASMRVPYKEQLKKENEELRAHLLNHHGGTKTKHKSLEEETGFAWMHRVLNSGHFEGSVCGNGWCSDYRPMFYGAT